MIKREDVEVGDVLQTPRGLERSNSPSYCLRVDRMSDNGVGGVKVRSADHEPRMSSSGFSVIEGGLSWSEVERCTLRKRERS